MKSKVKKYAGGNVVDSSGNPVRSGSGEPVRTRFGRDEEDRPKSSGVEDYASLGKRAGAVSPFSGPKETIKEETTTETETESPKGIASGFKSGESKFERDDNEVKMPAKKNPKPKSRYSGVVSAEEMGSQDFSSKSKPKGDSGLSKAALAAGLGLAGAAGAGALAARRQMKSGTRGERVEPTMGGTTRSPVRSMSAEEAAFENEGGRYFKKGGKVKKYADGGMTQQPTYPFYGNQPQAGGQNGGMNQTFNMQTQPAFKKGGKVSSASKRADGCAIRGKTRA